MEFEYAVINATDSDCMTQRGIDLNSAGDKIKRCFVDGLNKLEIKDDEQSFKDALYRFICKEDVYGTCNEEIITTFGPCLSEQNQQVVKQYSQISEAKVKVYCGNDGENFNILEGAGPGSCPDPPKENYVKVNCKQTFNDVSVNLEDFFSQQRCEKFKEFVNCIINNDDNCSTEKEVIAAMYNGMYDASPCASY